MSGWQEGKKRWKPALCLLLAVAPWTFVGAAGLDTDTTRLKSSDYNKSTTTDRFSSPGSVEMDNGMIVKWGVDTVPGLAMSTNVVFSEAFPNDLLSVELTVEAGALSGTSATVSAASESGFTINLQCLALTGPVVCTADTNVKWSARGY